MYTRDTQLIYYFNRVTGICRLCIPLVMAPDLLAIAYGKSHLGFAHYYECKGAGQLVHY